MFYWNSISMGFSKYSNDIFILTNKKKASIWNRTPSLMGYFLTLHRPLNRMLWIYRVGFCKKDFNKIFWHGFPYHVSHRNKTWDISSIGLSFFLILSGITSSHVFFSRTWMIFYWEIISFYYLGRQMPWHLNF